MTTNNHPAHDPVSLERLHQISEILSKAAAQSDGGNLGYAMADAVKVIEGAIAAFNVQPVAIAPVMYKGIELLKKDGLELIRDGITEATELESMCMAKALLSAQPAQVVPDEMDLQTCHLDGVTETYAEGWNAYRAAMLQGADGNSPVIPDGWVACSERMPEQFVEVLVCTEDGSRYVAALNQSMNWDDGDFFDDIQYVTHWMPLPAAPQQEVKQ